MRRMIYCSEHGQLKPMPDADIAAGIKRERSAGVATHSCFCDLCNARIDKGDPIVAESTGREINSDWHSEFVDKK